MKHSLGSCCNCGREDDSVRTIFMVDRQSLEPGIGCWGCLVCGLPQAGAVAVLCDECIDRSMGKLGHEETLKRVCLGSPADNRRILFSALSAEPFQHDLAKHAEEESAVPVTFPEELAERLADTIIDHVSTEIERDMKRRERHQKN